ncbi:winged helix-turn-helix transcriptional regulator [Sporomusa termitida]|uniref:HxlR-like helix-turn-helix n=1 Tax=Sporomusa termitida TaxID=2377 RepID=A0A517DZD6_9FIRM|nr:helix-turn-helix domain-containing protein [Sporomusa termitida]QDR82701.1 HxlR-like helix-turn-helix [Sporomusa termitida]
MSRAAIRGLCPVTVKQMLLAQKLIAGKWKFVILLFLSDGTKRFNELNRLLPDISQGILTQQLRELERDGIVHREIYKEIPPKVEYSLTEIGRNFIPVLDQVLQWIQFYNEHDNKPGASNPAEKPSLVSLS